MNLFKALSSNDSQHDSGEGLGRVFEQEMALGFVASLDTVIGTGLHNEVAKPAVSLQVAVVLAVLFLIQEARAKLAVLAVVLALVPLLFRDACALQFPS